MMNIKNKKTNSPNLKRQLPGKLTKIAICFALLQLGGCASLGVEPWERELLARDEMSLNADAVDIALDEHIYFSKEATSGGRAFAGGGCGCN